MRSNCPKKLLVHICCAPCATYSLEKLSNDGFNVTGYFFNPNIHPAEEYDRRKKELAEYTKIRKISLIIQDEQASIWYDYIKGLEHQPEKGARCTKCFELRLEQTFQYAINNGFDCVGTVLTISPHKNSVIINEIGEMLSQKYGLPFILKDFKKCNGFQKSLQISKEYNLYRQSYCGCEFSMR